MAAQSPAGPPIGFGISSAGRIVAAADGGRRGSGEGEPFPVGVGGTEGRAVEAGGPDVASTGGKAGGVVRPGRVGFPASEVTEDAFEA